jgi:hypothetical protein
MLNPPLASLDPSKGMVMAIAWLCKTLKLHDL